jgi:hypothetical protein
MVSWCVDPLLTGVGIAMPRLTITLSEERHRALKEAAIRRGKTIRELIEESLDYYGIKTTQKAAELVTRARRRASLTESEAVELATQETRSARQDARSSRRH